jgi:hypothetical protein
MLIMTTFYCYKECDLVPQSTCSQVTEALARAGLESSNLIVGIDFTKSNEWTGLTSNVQIQALCFFLFPTCINLLACLNIRCKVIQPQKLASHWG